MIINNNIIITRRDLARTSARLLGDVVYIIYCLVNFYSALLICVHRQLDDVIRLLRWIITTTRRITRGVSSSTLKTPRWKRKKKKHRQYDYSENNRRQYNIVTQHRILNWCYRKVWKTYAITWSSIIIIIGNELNYSFSLTDVLPSILHIFDVWSAVDMVRLI